MCKVFTATELHNKTRSELSALFKIVTQELNESSPDTAKRRNRQASLNNISKAMVKPPQPKPKADYLMPVLTFRGWLFLWQGCCKVSGFFS